MYTVTATIPTRRKGDQYRIAKRLYMSEGYGERYLTGTHTVPNTNYNCVMAQGQHCYIQTLLLTHTVV